MHWNGYREFVESVLAYCDLKQYRSPDSDDEYGWARLCQIIGNTLGGTLSLGVGRYERMDTDNYDNGTYIIQGWDIKDRLYKHYADNKREYSIFEALKQINERQPKEEQLKEEEIEIYAKNWEEKHLDRLKQEDKIIVEKRIKEMQDTKIDTIKEQEISYEILEKQVQPINLIKEMMSIEDNLENSKEQLIRNIDLLNDSINKIAMKLIKIN